MEKETAQKIVRAMEQEYDAIAQKFSQTRKHFWRELEFIKKYARKGENILDFGCGNGRLLDLIGKSGIDYYGVDVSGELIKIAREKYHGSHMHFAKIDPLAKELPFIDGFFNTVYSIAVFHHFPSQEYRKRMAKELFARTKKGGAIVVTVWYLWPSLIPLLRRRKKEYFILIVKNWFEKMWGKSELDWNDCFIPFTDNAGKKIQRFHHAFTERELKNLFSSVGFNIERCEVVGGRNIVLVGHK